MKDVILRRLAEQVRRMRIERGMSQAQLAAAANVSRKTLIELEKAAPGIALGTVVAVLETMGGELNIVSASRPTTAEMRALLGLEEPAYTPGRSALMRTAGTPQGLPRVRVTPRPPGKSDNS